MITQAELKERLHYDLCTGIFTWIKPKESAHSISSGDIAGGNNGKNAIRICVCAHHYLAHRLAWFYVHGEWPDQIDHINGNRSDNRLCNLRSADNSQNQANMKAKSNNRLGIRGVGKKGNQYVVQLRKGNERIHRSFNNLEDAKEFSISESMRLHGEFSIYANVNAVAIVDPSRGKLALR